MALIDPSPFSASASACQILVSMISLEPRDGMPPNLHGNIIGTSLRVD